MNTLLLLITTLVQMGLLDSVSHSLEKPSPLRKAHKRRQLYRESFLVQNEHNFELNQKVEEVHGDKKSRDNYIESLHEIDVIKEVEQRENGDGRSNLEYDDDENSAVMEELITYRAKKSASGSDGKKKMKKKKKHEKGANALSPAPIVSVYPSYLYTKSPKKMKSSKSIKTKSPPNYFHTKSPKKMQPTKQMNKTKSPYPSQVLNTGPPTISPAPTRMNNKSTKKSKGKSKKYKSPKTKAKKSNKCYTYIGKAEDKKSKKKSVPCSGTFDPTQSPTRQPNSAQPNSTQPNRQINKSQPTSSPTIINSKTPTKSPIPTPSPSCDGLDCPRPVGSTTTTIAPQPEKDPSSQPSTQSIPSSIPTPFVCSGLDCNRPTNTLGQEFKFTRNPTTSPRPSGTEIDVIE